MYLKSLEVHGFKSFANKLIFEFHNGITAIVGPNGSGKSNVADAVRWVLGEQSAKQLRGAKMEDIIFAGTELRKPLGYAYVAITISNEDHKLNVPYEEVTIARRVYRSGESEYLLNGASCRLRDIQELLFDTGIGKEGYSIIGQGQIDKILSGKPEDRRELFDEAAGIVKFKKRKAAAEKNLAEEQQNMVRIEDILSELEKQVGPLEKQSEKAHEYLIYRDELRGLDVNIFLMEYDQIHTEMEDVSRKQDIASADLENARKDILAQMAIGKIFEGITISDEEIREYFEANKARFAKGASVHAKHILVDSEDKCNELLESIVSGGKAFEDVAKESSTCPSGANGGDLGEFGKGQMVKEFEDAAFAAEIGHVVGPVKTQFGYHLIKVEDKKEAEDAKLDDVKEQIKSEIMQKKQQEAYTAKVE